MIIMEEEINLNEEQQLNEAQLLDYAERLQRSKPIVTKAMLEAIEDECRKEGIVTLDYKIEGLDSIRVFRGSIGIYVNRSWIDSSLPLKTSKYFRVKGRKRVKHGDPQRVITDAPRSFRKKIVSIHNTSVVGKFNQGEWTDVLARASAVFTVLSQYAQDLQRNKLIELENGSDRFNEILESLGHQEATTESGVPQGSSEIAGETGEVGNFAEKSE